MLDLLHLELNEVQQYGSVIWFLNAVDDAIY